MPLSIPEPRASGSTRNTSVPLSWARYGDPSGPPLLVLHGGPGADHRYLLPQMLRLGDRYDLLFYDQRGGGQSRTDDPTPITWRTQVDDLAAVVAELAPGPLSLVGFSWGALLALLYAMEAAEGHVAPEPARLVLIDPAPIAQAFRATFDAEMTRRQQSAAVTEARAALTASDLAVRDRDAYRQRAFELSVAGYFAHLERAHDLTPFRVIGAVQQSIWRSLDDYDLTDRLRTVRSPAIVFHGRQDPIPLESSATVARQTGAELVVIEDCGHVPYVEQPEPLFSAIERFLAATAHH